MPQFFELLGALGQTERPLELVAAIHFQQEAAHIQLVSIGPLVRHPTEQRGPDFIDGDDTAWPLDHHLLQRADRERIAGGV
jgi:hypothetical protein